jgi:hypothetical protein
MPTENFGDFAGRVNNGILARQTATSGVAVTLPEANSASARVIRDGDEPGEGPAVSAMLRKRK